MEERNKKGAESVSPTKVDDDTQPTDLNQVLDSLNPEQRHTLVKAFMAIESERSFEDRFLPPRTSRHTERLSPMHPSVFWQ